MEEVTTPTTTTTESAPAAPATSAPDSSSATPIVPSRPTSMRDALEREAAKTEPPVVPAAAATVQPTAPLKPGDPVPPKEPGPMPFREHKTALENARVKAATEAVQQRDAAWQKEVGVFAQLTPEQRSGARNMLRDIYTNPVAFIQRSVSELLQGPQSAAVRAALAPLVGHGQQTAPVQDAMPPPDVQILNDQGQVAGMTYSAEQLAKRDAWNERQYLAKVDERIAPFQHAEQSRKQQAEQADAERKAAAQHQQWQTQTDATLAEIADILEIAHTDAANPLWKDVDDLSKAHPEWSAHRAALEVQKTKVTPRRQGQAAQAVLTDMQRKAAGNTANGSGASAMPKRPTNPKELSAFLKARAEAGGEA